MMYIFLIMLCLRPRTHVYTHTHANNIYINIYIYIYIYIYIFQFINNIFIRNTILDLHNSDIGLPLEISRSSLSCYSHFLFILLITFLSLYYIYGT